MLELGPLVSPAMGKVSNMLEQRKGSALSSVKEPSAPPVKSLAAAPGNRTEAQQMGAQTKQARKKAEEDKIKQKVMDKMGENSAKAGYGKPKPQDPKDLKPLRNATPKSVGDPEKTQKIADEQKLEGLKAKRDEYTKQWVEAARKGNHEESEKALAARNLVSKEYDNFKKEYDNKYNGSAAQELSAVEKIQKMADDRQLAGLKAQQEYYLKEWQNTIGKGDLEATKKASVVKDYTKKKYDDFKKEYDDKYNRPVAKSPKELMDQEAKRVRDRIQSRIEQGPSGMSKEYGKFKNLSDDELAAMGLYGENKSKYFMDVNKFLRTGSMEGIPPERQQIVQNIVSNMNSALNKLPASSETNFERAVSGPGARGLRNLKVGDIIEDKGFGSYTLAGKPVTLDQFFRQKEDNAVMRVTSRNARNVSPIMEFQREAEHILRPGTKLRVTEVIEANAPGAHRSRAVGSIPTYTFEEVE